MKGYHLHNRLLIWSIRNFSKNMRISNIAKYTVKSRFPGGTSSCQFWVLPIDCPPGWTFLGDYNNKEWIKLSLFSCPQLVGKSLQRPRYVLQCNNRLAPSPYSKLTFPSHKTFSETFPFSYMYMEFLLEKCSWKSKSFQFLRKKKFRRA